MADSECSVEGKIVPNSIHAVPDNSDNLLVADGNSVNSIDNHMSKIHLINFPHILVGIVQPICRSIPYVQCQSF